MTLHEFFTAYAAHATASAPEPLAALYAHTFIAGGPQGSQAFTNDARFLDWLRQMAAFNRQSGMREMTVASIRDLTLSPLHTLATVRWGARFEKTGDRLIEFDISYLVEKAGGAWRVLAYISAADQEAEMKKHGLM